MSHHSNRSLGGTILTCSTAHESAYTKAKYIHRDVSAGNILIRVVVKSKAGNNCVVWEGTLSDWELAKFIDIDYAVQPERTVRTPLQKDVSFH